MTSQRRIRRAARVLMVDEGGRILLLRYTPGDRPPLWCAPGGACDDGESYEACAAREVLEETGITIDPGAEVDRRFTDFTTFDGEPVTGDDRYFMVRVANPAIRPHALTPTELAVMAGHRWFAPDEIDGWPEVIYPLDMSAMLAKVGLM